MMNAEQVRAMAPQWLQGGRNMVPAPYRNHPEILNYMANNNNSVFNYESINQQARTALNGNIHNASSAVTPAPTSTVTGTAVELSDEALYTSLNATDDGVGAALRGAGHNMPTPTPTPKPAVTVPTPVKVPLNPGSVPVADLKNVTLNMPTSTPTTNVPTSVKAPFNPGSVPVSDLKNVTLNTEAISKVDDVAKGFNWAKAGKIGAIVVGAAAIIAGAAWLINKACKKDETPVDETPVEDTPAKTEPETPAAPVAPNEPEVPVVPVAPTEPEVPVAPTEPTEPEAPATPELKTEYEAQRGDGIWHIAERYLKDKYANEPDKFENLTTEEKNKMILDETLRIAELNNYELVERTINGKKQIVPNPTLHPGDKVKVQ